MIHPPCKTNHSIFTVTRLYLSSVLSLFLRTRLMEMCEPVNTCMVCSSLSPDFERELLTGRQEKVGKPISYLFPLVYTQSLFLCLSLTHTPDQNIQNPYGRNQNCKVPKEARNDSRVSKGGLGAQQLSVQGLLVVSPS